MNRYRQAGSGIIDMNRLKLARLLVVLAILLLLEVACRTGLISAYSLIPPSQMVVAMIEMLRSGELTAEIAQTLLAIVISVVAAIVVGILVAIVLQSFASWLWG